MDFEGDEARARQVLANLEQLRWVLGGILENKDLQATWPFRVLLTRSAPPDEITPRLVHGQYVLALRPDAPVPTAEIARIFIQENTPRFPAEVDSALPLLFEGLEARGAQVTWAKKPARPDLAWARLQYFATTPAYAGRFPVFINNLRGGSLLEPAEANAFGKDSKVLEQEIQSYLSSGPRDSATISARPLDPKRDFGEHSLDAALGDLYLAGTRLKSDRARAEQAYKAAGDAGYTALAQEGIALIVLEEGGDPREYLDGAITASTKDAWIYAKAAEGRSPQEAAALLRTARDLNPRWWLPPARLADLAAKPAEKEAFLVEACQKDPRSAALWQQLARLQSGEGKGIAAQNSWIRAEDAAATPEERAKIHQARVQLENQRLDAEENAKKREAEEARAEDDRLKNEHLARIREAEAQANQTNQANGSGTGNSSENKDVVPWWNADERPVSGELVRVDCMNPRARLSIKTSAGKTMMLLVRDPSKVSIEGGNGQLGCGIQKPGRMIDLTFKSRADRQLGTSGDVVAIHFR